MSGETETNKQPASEKEFFLELLTTTKHSDFRSSLLDLNSDLSLEEIYQLFRHKYQIYTEKKNNFPITNAVTQMFERFGKLDDKVVDYLHTADKFYQALKIFPSLVKEEGVNEILDLLRRGK